MFELKACNPSQICNATARYSKDEAGSLDTRGLFGCRPWLPCQITARQLFGARFTAVGSPTNQHRNWRADQNLGVYTKIGFKPTYANQSVNDQKFGKAAPDCDPNRPKITRGAVQAPGVGMTKPGVEWWSRCCPMSSVYHVDFICGEEHP